MQKTVDEDAGGFATKCAHHRHHVGEETDFFLEVPIHQLNRSRIKSRPGQLGKITALRFAVRGEFHLRQINGCDAAAADDSPGAPPIERQTKLAREDVDGAQRQHTQANAQQILRVFGDAIEHFVYRAVSAGGDDDLKILARRFGGQGSGRAGGGRWLERAIRADGIEVAAKAFRLFASGCRIENDANTRRMTHS